MHGTRRFAGLVCGAVFAVAAMAIAAEAHDGAGSSDGVIDNAGATHDHHDVQHGDDEGHLPPSSDNVRLVSELELKNVEPGKIADVGVHNGYDGTGSGGTHCPEPAHRT